MEPIPTPGFPPVTRGYPHAPPLGGCLAGSRRPNACHRGEHDKVLEHLHQMLAENDEALQAKGVMPGKEKPHAAGKPAR